MKNHFDEYPESRLNEWAEWLRSGNMLGIGYPRQSTLNLIREGKAISRSPKSCSVIESNESAEEIERLICEVAKYKPIMAQCLRMYYLDGLSLRSNSKKLGISYNQFKLYVLMGRQWMIGILTQKL